MSPLPYPTVKKEFKLGQFHLYQMECTEVVPPLIMYAVPSEYKKSQMYPLLLWVVSKWLDKKNYVHITLSFKLYVKNDYTFAKSDQLDCSNSTIAFKDIDFLNGLWQNLWDDVIRIKNEGLEHLFWWDWTGDFLVICDRCHDQLGWIAWRKYWIKRKWK